MNAAQPSHRVLCLPSHAASLKEMLYVAARLAETGRYQCTFAVDWHCPPQWCAQVENAGHELILRRKPATAAAPSFNRDPTGSAGNRDRASLRESRAPRWVAVKQGWANLSRVTGLKSVSEFARFLWSFGKAVRRAERLLDRVRPDVLLTPSDRLVGIETAMIVRAHRRGIPTVVVPWAISLPAGIAFYRASQPDWEWSYGTRRWLNRLVARRYPDLVHAYEGRSLLFLPGEAILAAQAWGILNPHPWRYVGGGLADLVLVEGERSYDTAVAAGMPPARLANTGRASSDVVYENLLRASAGRRQICDQFGLPAENRILLCSVPQLAEHNLCSHARHQQEIEFLFATLGVLPNTNVLLSLHPKSNPAHYESLAARHRLAIANPRPIEELIPVCDVFLSAFSSTVVMAIGCGKPSVLLDLYGMGYDLFDACPGTLRVRAKEDLRPLLERLLADRAYYSQLAEAQRQVAPQWIALDGQCARRMIGALDGLISAATSLRPSATGSLGPQEKAA